MMWILPLAATLISAICAGIPLRYWYGSRHPAHLMWFLALTGIAVAAACLFLGSVSGWTALVAKLYYLLASVAFTGGLSLGTAYLLAPRVIAHIWLVALVASAVTIAILLAGTGVDMGKLSDEGMAGWKAIDAGGALPGVAATINSIGTLVLLTGAVYAFVYKRLAAASALIAAGSLVIYYGSNIVAAASTYELASLPQIAGVLVVIAGITMTREAPPKW